MSKTGRGSLRAVVLLVKSINQVGSVTCPKEIVRIEISAHAFP